MQVHAGLSPSDALMLGTDRDLFAWLVAHGIAAWTVGDLLVALPFDHSMP